MSVRKCENSGLVRLFAKMADFINFEADVIHGDVIDNRDSAMQTVDDDEFIDDETQIDESIEDYYAFTNVCRSVENGKQNSFLESDSRESHEVNNYCNDNYDPDSEQIHKFRDSAKRVQEFERTLLCPQCLEIQDSFYYAILFAICYQLEK